MRAFQLTPFPTGMIPQITITGDIERDENRLSIRYCVSGETDSIIFPAVSDSPSRQHDLWKTTCFELFIAIEDQPGYWEFNLSPSRDWNVYAMDAYRQVNMREETRIQRSQFEAWKDAGLVSLQAAIDLDPIIEKGKAIEAGISMIVQTRDGAETYWALAHPGAQADFHLREGFVIHL